MLELPVTPNDSLETSFTTQEWSAYSADEHRTWARLYEHRLAALQAAASRLYLQGLEALAVSPRQVADLAAVNAIIAERTGWQAVAVRSLLPRRAFFKALARRRFPVNVTMRPPEALDYFGPDPDIFHGVVGHLPLLAHRTFADFLQHFGVLASRAATEEQFEKLTRLYWFTVEFGLVRERGEARLYGAGLLSSAENAGRALSPASEHHPFAVDTAFELPFTTDREQREFLVIDDFRALWASLQEAARRLKLG